MTRVEAPPSACRKQYKATSHSCTCHVAPPACQAPPPRLPSRRHSDGELHDLFGNAVLNWYSSQFKNNHFTEMCCGTEAGSYLRLIDSCITQRKAQRPSRTCNESKEEEEEHFEGELHDLFGTVRAPFTRRKAPKLPIDFGGPKEKPSNPQWQRQRDNSQFTCGKPPPQLAHCEDRIGTGPPRARI